MFDGERLAELRKDKGLTQKQLADKLNISWKTLSKYERGLHSPGDKLKVAIAKYFDVSLDYFFCLTEDEFPLKKDGFIILPRNYSKEFKAELIYLLDLLKSKYHMK